MWHQGFNRNFMTPHVHESTQCMCEMQLKQEPAFWRRMSISVSSSSVWSVHHHHLVQISKTASWYSRECASKTDTEEKKLLNKVISVFFAHKKYSCSFIKLGLNHWCHMDYFIDVLATGPWTCQLRCSLCRVRKLLDFIKNILICVQKLNEGIMGLEQHEGE